jgi:hypothetical protein
MNSRVQSVGFLEIDRESQMGGASPRQRGAHGVVDERRDLHRHVHECVVLGHVLEKMLEVHLLLIARAEQRRRLHPGDGQHRRVVELRVVQAVEQMDGSGP